MKKLICTVMASALLALSLVGCGSSSSSDVGYGSSSSSDAGTTSAASSDAGGVTGAITVVSREDGSGTRGAFVELLGIVDDQKNDATTETAEITNSTSVMLSTVAGNTNAIGYVSLGSLSDTVKAVKVDGIECTAENIKSGEYKVARPFNLAYYDGELSETAQDLINYIMSSDGQAIVEKEGYIPIEGGSAYESKKLSGKITVAGSTSVAPLMNVIADEYKKVNPDVTIEIQESGSTAGIQSATEKAVDIGMSSRELKDEEAAKLATKQIAMDGIAVIENQSNTIDTLTSEQIKSVYLGETTAWEDLK